MIAIKPLRTLRLKHLISDIAEAITQSSTNEKQSPQRESIFNLSLDINEKISENQLNLRHLPAGKSVIYKNDGRHK